LLLCVEVKTKDKQNGWKRNKKRNTPGDEDPK
jgi:hypothetical protein